MVLCLKRMFAASSFAGHPGKRILLISTSIASTGDEKWISFFTLHHGFLPSKPKLESEFTRVMHDRLPIFSPRRSPVRIGGPRDSASS